MNLQIQDLTASHRKDLRPLIEHLSFTLREGDRCAVIGEEGNGKSTLLKIIAAPEEAEGYVEYEGRIIKGNAVIGYLRQELPERDQCLTVWEYFSASERFLDKTPEELAQLARTFGVPADFFYEDRPMGSLSGGEKVKMQLARILMDSPDILLLDEPSGDLDLDALHWLEGFIVSCEKPVLYVSHDETLLERTANMIIHLELVRRKTFPRHTVSRTGYREYVTRRLDAIAHQEQMARDEKARFDAQQKRLREIKEKVQHEMDTLPHTTALPHTGKMLKRKMHTITSMSKRFEREEENMTQMPDTEDAILMRFGRTEIPASKRVLDYRADTLLCGGEEPRILARNLRLSVTGGEKICIIGQNGVGKSTFLRQLASEMLGRRDIKAAYMPQSYEDLLPMDATPVEFLAKEGSRTEYAEIRTYLGSVKYTPEEMEHKISDLSGGQKAKLLFIHMIRSGANVLLLDEPTRNFSPMSGPMIRKILRAFGGAIIAVSHDRKFIGEVFDRVYRLTPEGLALTEKEKLL